MPENVCEKARDTIQEILRGLPDDESRKVVLRSLLENRCRTCLDHDPQGQFWCCYDSRGDRI